MKLRLFVAAAVLSAFPGAALAQTPPAAAQTPAAQPQAPMPPAGSGPVFRNLAPRCEPDNVCIVDGLTYLYYIETRPSVGSQGQWVPWSDAIAESLRRDFNRLWATNFLDDLWIEVVDNKYPNGVVAKDVIIHMVERQRVKIVDYQGSKRVETQAIEDKLAELGISIRIDTFIDPPTIRRVTGVVRDLYAEKGYMYADVKPEIRSVAGGPKLVHLTFHVNEGPKVKIREVDFVGNSAIKDGKLRGKMKENKAQGWLSFVTGAGTYQEAKFAEDAEAVTGYYLDKGYIRARVGQPQIEIMEDSPDGSTRWVRLRVPVDEGPRYRVGEITFEGNNLVTDEGFAALFKMKKGDWYSHKKFMKGREKAQEVYGGGGYMEFNAYPDFPDLTAEATQSTEQPAATPEGTPAARPMPPGTDVTNVVVRVEEGPQYFVNRITFQGNTTTRDSVIRRELRIAESGVFNTEGLKQSIRRLNQLGYFKPLEGNDDVKVEKAPDAENRVDVTLKVAEQNRNTLQFGAGVSQFEGFFGNLSFQTANFLGRGETLSISLQQGSRAKNYQVAFTEPYLFDRPITAGIDIFVREIRYIGQFTQASKGANTVWGFPLANFTRMYLGYSYENTELKEVDPFFDPAVLAQYLLLGDEGQRIVSKISPSFVHNTVDNPIFASSGKRYSASFDFAGLGGLKFWNSRLEAVQYVPLSRRVSLGFRVQSEYVRPFGETAIVGENGLNGLPIYEKLFMGGEYSVRGFDIRTISPRNADGFIVGGNKSLLFNGEFIVNVGGPVRALLFYDAGQVQDFGDRIRFRDTLDAATGRTLRGFKTSTGAEIRFFMPVLNVPFRLIFAYNPQRDGIFDNQLLPQKKFTFKFAVGSTF